MSKEELVDILLRLQASKNSGTKMRFYLKSKSYFQKTLYFFTAGPDKSKSFEI